jgi:hypothetical protein
MVNFGISSIEKNSKMYLIAVLALNMVLRIPRVGGIIGDDAFRVIWMGQVLSEGYTDLWTVSIFSLFGLYPFSFYPIGVPLVVASLFYLGVSLEVTVFLLSEITGIIGVIGSYCLGAQLFKNKEKGLVFSLLYSISPIFLRVSYYTITVRGPFMAILPWLLLYAWKLYRESEKKYILHVSVLFFLLAMSHRLAILMAFYLLPLVGVALLPLMVSIPKRLSSRIPFVSKIQNPIGPKIHSLESSLRRRRVLGNMGLFHLFLTGVVLVGTYLLALILIPIDPRKTAEVFLPNTTLLGVSVNLIIDYGLRLGIASVFIPIGFLYKLDCAYSHSAWYLHLSTMIVAIFILPRSVYASLIILPIFVYYSLEGLYLMFNRFGKGPTNVVILLGSIIFTGFYYIITVALVSYLILACIILGGFISLFIVRRRGFLTTYKWPMLVIGIVLFSLVSIDGLIEVDPNYYLDAEEKTIITSLTTRNETGIVFSMRSDLARRLLAYGIPVVVNDADGITSLYYEWITPEEIVAWTVLETDIIELASSGSLFKFKAPYPEQVLWSTFFNTDLTNQTQAEIALALGLRYVIVEKTRDGTSDYYEDVSFPSPLLESVPYIGEIICETENLIVYIIG